MGITGGWMASSIYFIWKYAPFEQEKTIKEQEKTIKFERQQKERQKELHDICVEKVERYFNNRGK